MSDGYWRNIARPIIAKIIAETEPSKLRNKLLREAYPFGERAMWPYKVWCDEVQIQTGSKKAAKRAEFEKEFAEDKNQFKLFEEAT